MKPDVFDHKSWKALRWTASLFASNIYLILPSKGDEAMLVDAGGRAKEVLRALKQEGRKLKWIVLTHGHFDHTTAANKLSRATKARILIGKEEAGRSKPYRDGGKALEDGDVIRVGNIDVKVIATPGHTRGGISLYLPGAVFTGDTLFAGGIGRTDFKGGSMEAIMQSIKEKLLALPDDTAVYPGHGPPSTIGRERRSNPFIIRDRR